MEVFTVTEAAKRLKLSTQTIRNWCRRGNISSVRRGKKIFIPVSEIENFDVRVQPEHEIEDVREKLRQMLT